MKKSFFVFGGVSGALAVALGALGAHFLKEHVSEKMMLAFETGVRYQVYHSLALILVGIIHERFEERLLRRAGRLFMAGIILFSGSLYAMTVADLCHFYSDSYSWIGAITPLGGLSFITGWVFFFLTFLMY